MVAGGQIAANTDAWATQQLTSPVPPGKKYKLAAGAGLQNNPIWVEWRYKGLK